MKVLKIIISITVINACIMTGMVLMSHYLQESSAQSAVGVSVTTGTNAPTASGITLPALVITPNQNQEQFLKLRAAATPTVLIGKKTSPTTAPAAAAIKPTASAPMATNAPVATVASTSAPQPTQDARCIISVNGVQYDVTAFRNIHSGGNIFTCGTDMTQVFYSQHSDKTLERMQQYKL